MAGVIIAHDKNNIGTGFSNHMGDSTKDERKILFNGGESTIIMHSYRFTGAQIFDGSGSPPFPGTVEVKGERITAIFPASDTLVQSFDGETIDCRGLFLCPGFIDVHCHTDFNILADARQGEKLSQGITTALGGNCGLGLFPLNAEVTRYYQLYGRQLFGLEHPPLFESIREFLDAIEQQGPPGINFGTLIPHGNIRAVVMGADSSSASPDQLRLMQDAIQRNLDEGAFGLSAGLIYPPGIFSSTTELIALCKTVAANGGIFTCHMRDEANHIIDSIREMEQIQRTTGCRVHISHLKIGASINRRKLKPVSMLFKQSREYSPPLTADLYPYGWGFTSLSAIALPPWVFEGSDDDIRSRLVNPEIQQQLLHEFLEKMVELAGVPFLKKIPRRLLLKIAEMVFSRIARIVGLKNHPDREGLMLGEYLHKYYPSGTFFDKIFRVLADEDCAITIAMQTMDEHRVMEPLWQLSNVMMGTDSMTPLYAEMGTHPRVFGTTGKILGRITRERKVLSWEQAIHKMTGLPAAVFQLENRGELKPGNFADIVIFDPNRICDTATFGNCRAKCEGIHSVFVNGSLAWQNGEFCASAGKILRKMKK
jgi:N-acyl-D-amino-acid deacylase